MKLWPLVVLLGMAACANPVNRHTASNYFQRGQEALSRGDFAAARVAFSRAHINAKLGHMGPEAEGQALSKLGVASGNMCLHDEAEEAFRGAVAAYSKADGDQPWRTFPARVELAQFSYDIGRYQKAASYFEEAFAVGGAELEEIDPAGFAVIMDDYAEALKHLGRASEEANARAKANAARTRGVKGKSAVQSDDYVRYPKVCK